MSFVPSYLPLFRSGELRRRAQALDHMLESCSICPHLCSNNRRLDERARCSSGALPVVSAYAVHFGEEPGLVGRNGVGNVFFGNCNLRCVYCQNHVISQNAREERHREVSIERLARIMLELQEREVHAIGLVSPTHFVPQIVSALEIAVARGLALPLIYNTNAYDSVEVLRLLEGIIDIYLPDLKYADDEMGFRYSKIREYSRYAKAAITEMHRQVGTDLVTGEDGLIRRGLIVRHLVLPNDIAGSVDSLRWLKTALGAHATLSVMSQYFPTHQAGITPLLDRKLRPSEYERVLRFLDLFEMEKGWVQDFSASEYYTPEFENRTRPFAGEPDNYE
jgi:putative pyruvate formate lyase activating enzyme